MSSSPGIITVLMLLLITLTNHSPSWGVGAAQGGEGSPAAHAHQGPGQQTHASDGDAALDALKALCPIVEPTGSTSADVIPLALEVAKALSATVKLLVPKLPLTPTAASGGGTGMTYRVDIDTT